MATKNFTQFSTTTLTSGDYIVGYKEDGSAEFRSPVQDIVNLVQDSDNQTLSFNESSKDLAISSGNTVSLSALVDSSVDTGVRALTGNWQDTYTIVQANSASWEESAEILPTVTNYLSTNNVLISSLQVNGFASFDGSRSLTIGGNTYTYSLTSKEPIIANKNLFIYDSINFPTGPLKAVFAESGNFRTTSQPTIILGTNSDQHFRIRTGGFTNEDIRMTFLSSGEVGIGTTLAETAAAGSGGLIIKNNLLVGSNTTISGTVSASSTIFSSNRQVVTTNTTTVPGTSAVTSILAVSALPGTQEPGVLYIVI
jgi:hypothetical protein